MNYKEYFKEKILNLFEEEGIMDRYRKTGAYHSGHAELESKAKNIIGAISGGSGLNPKNGGPMLGPGEGITADSNKPKK